MQGRGRTNLNGQGGRAPEICAVDGGFNKERTDRLRARFADVLRDPRRNGGRTEDPFLADDSEVRQVVARANSR